MPVDTWILIIMFSGNSFGDIEHMEFDSESACNTARIHIERMSSFDRNNEIEGLCVRKG